MLTQMYDAGDGSEDETYFGGPNGHADSDDDDDFAEAHGAFATPAGSNMGDDDEHAIGDVNIYRNSLLLSDRPALLTATLLTVAASQRMCNIPQAGSI